MLSITPAHAARLLVAHHGLDGSLVLSGAQGVRQLLGKARCIQLDPLAPVASNADLVAMARVDGLAVGDVYLHLLSGHAFEHYAKERCLLPASAFPYYRAQAVETPWWRCTARLRRLSPQLLEDVYQEIRKRGPLTAAQLSDRGQVEPLDWSGWKGTAKAATMATQVLALRCQVVVCGRAGRAKLYDIPERALGPLAMAAPQGSFHRWALLERVQAAGLLMRAAGPQWGQLREVRKQLSQELIDAGQVLEIKVQGSSRTYLAPPELLERALPEPDGRMRVLGPLDPMIWDRKLVQQAFGFEYVWEVYKPAAKRRWGWYVMPLLHRGRLVGRFEGHREQGRVVVDRVWEQAGERFEQGAFERCLERLG